MPTLTVSNPPPKTYIGFSLDFSGSMCSIAPSAAKDFNNKIAGIRAAALDEHIDTIVCAVKCGVGRSGAVVPFIRNSSIVALQDMPISEYVADGHSTPLFQSIGELIDMLEAMPDADDSNVNFIVEATTDGEDNSSRGKWTPTAVMHKMRQLESTDRWTFIFRVPTGHYAHSLHKRFGVHPGNIQEWNTTEAGLARASAEATAGYTRAFTAKAAGTQSTNRFFADLSDVTAADVASVMTDISASTMFWPVSDTCQIRPFCEARLGGVMKKGAAFYQLTKPEDEVQDYKQIALRDKTSGKVYVGPAARQLLGLPTIGMVRVAPGDHGTFDIFMQSTSINRKLIEGTTLMYWPGAQVLK